MAYKAYNTWKNMVARKQRSLDEQRNNLERSVKYLVELKTAHAKGERMFSDTRFWKRDIKSTSKKIEKLEAELASIMQSIPADVQSEINEMEEIYRTFADFISFIEQKWNERDEMLKKACDEWLDASLKALHDSWRNMYKTLEDEFNKQNTEYVNWRVRRDAFEAFVDSHMVENYTKPMNEMLEKANFFDESEYQRVSTHSIEDLKKENLNDAKQSVLTLVDRVEDKVGKVTNWSDLHFGANGMLNGRVEGTCGKTYVETIGAGGYNIVRFHYRVLLKNIK